MISNYAAKPFGLKLLRRLHGEVEQSVRAFFWGISAVGIIDRDFGKTGVSEPAGQVLFAVGTLTMDFGEDLALSAVSRVEDEAHMDSAEA